MIFGLFIQVGILWFLITLFTGSTNSSQSLRETWIVLAGMIAVSILTNWFLWPILGIFTIIINIAALYFLIDKVCGTARKTTIKICVWYFGISFLINIVMGLFLAT